MTLVSTGCTTDVELNAPYEERSLAFCLLDPAATEQWVRVNRTWLGEGNNLDIALVADSSEYAAGEVNVTVEQFHPDDIAFETPLLTFFGHGHLAARQGRQRDLLRPRVPRLPLSKPQTGLDVYVGSSDDLYTYRMTVAFADGRLPLTAVTTLIGSSPGNISNPPAGIPGFNLNFASGLQVR